MSQKNNHQKTVLVFGTFDGLHPGHIAFLRQAKKLGDRMVVSLPPKKVVQDLKGRKPDFSYRKRAKVLKQSGLPDAIIKGDKSTGVFSNILAVKPKIIALGYDQKKLQAALEDWIKKYNIETEIKVLDAYKPDQYKTSILRKV